MAMSGFSSGGDFAKNAIIPDFNALIPTRRNYAPEENNLGVGTPGVGNYSFYPEQTNQMVNTKQILIFKLTIAKAFFHIYVFQKLQVPAPD